MPVNDLLFARLGVGVKKQGWNGQPEQEGFNQAARLTLGPDELSLKPWDLELPLVPFGRQTFDRVVGWNGNNLVVGRRIGRILDFALDPKSFPGLTAVDRQRIADYRREYAGAG